MKQLLTLLGFILFTTTVKSQFITIQDAIFCNWLQTNIPSAMIGNQMDTTSLAVTTRTNISVENLGITNLNGIQYFDSLKTLDCGNSILVPLFNSLTNLPRLPKMLDTLICGENQLGSLPQLPFNLKFLSCYSNQISSLPSLPSSIKYINCTDNLIANIPLLPDSLRFFACRFNSLTNLPNLPDSLEYMDCGFNHIINIPTLPSILIELKCNGNLLNALPFLPNSIQVIDCSFNQITSIPNMPNGLQGIMCQNNLLSSLPNMPNSVFNIDCSYNQITSLPNNLPSSIIFLICNNNQLTNLPILPLNLGILNCENNNILCFAPFNYMTVLSIANNPFTCLPNYIAAMDSITLTYPLCGAGNLYGCNNAEGIVGFTYKDVNTTCIKDVGDIGLKNIHLKIYDNVNNLISQNYTALNGVYGFPQTANTYTIVIDTLNMPFISTCMYPGLDSTVTVATAALDTNINFALDCKPGFDVGIQSFITTGNVFPGQIHTLNVVAGDLTHWYNLNCASGIGGSLSFSVTGPVTYMGPAPGALTPSISGNIYSYIIPDYGAINNSNDFKLLFAINTTAQTGDAICVNAHAFPVIGDNVTSNNSNKSCYHVINSHDPNMKEVYPIDVHPGFNDWFTYTIHFQNTGNAPAYNIRLADTLDNMLDLETFQIINYSHINNTTLNGKILSVYFPNIMLPDSNSNPSGSIGYIQYRIKPKATWAAPYKIKNTAYIYFDYNTPIVTNSTYNSILVPTGLNNQSNTLTTLYPNPTNGTFTIELNTKEKQQMQMYDITGNVVLSQTIENGKAIIDASHLAAGIYNINVKGNSVVINKKMVIVK
jgi:uncharacterized repeat protein (TIGR01451 family)